MVRLCGLAVLAAALVVLASTACDRLSNLDIPGIVAGSVLNEAGQGQGYLTVKLVDEATGKEAYRDTTEDTGSFLIDKVKAGKYLLKVYRLGDEKTEVATDAKEIKLLPGKTLQRTITLLPAQT